MVVAGGTKGMSPKALRKGRTKPLPLVSCICPTYNRPPDHQYLIEEAIESFLRQTYPNKEMIVVNDCPDQELVCDAPGVRVVNVPKRFPTLGEKRNAGHRLARGELFAPWDDDDISLPWRLSLLVERLGGAPYLNPDKCWFVNSNGLHSDPFIGGVYPKAVFTRRAFEAVGGYQPITFEEDVALETAMRALSHQADPASLLLERRDWYYIYREQVSPIHVSSSGDDSAYVDAGNLPVQSGRYVMRPHWRMDYEAETRRLATADTGEANGLPRDGSASSVAGDRAEHVGTPATSPDTLDAPSPDIVLFVASNDDAPPKRNVALGTFPLVRQKRAEAARTHLSRVMRLVDEALGMGGTHLLVPRDVADWLADHPLLIEYFATQHELVGASADSGLLFALRSQAPIG
jgi:hypothetical protein